MPYKDKVLQKQAQHASYLRNKSKVSASTKSQKIKKYLYVQNLKTNTPCTDCGKNYHYSMMQFDHIGDNKIANIGKMVQHYAWFKVLEEIDKCEIVCANCHAYRSWIRLQK